jgi:hypothetical protein
VSSVLLFELLGLYFNYIKWDNTSVYILFDFIVFNLFLFFYIRNLFGKKSNAFYILTLCLNAFILVLCYFIFTQTSDFDFYYTLIYTTLNFILGVLLFWVSLGWEVKNQEVLKMNFLFLFFTLMSLVNKFFMYYSYFEDPLYIAFTQNFIFLYNIFGFGFTIKLFLNKNEN